MKNGKKQIRIFVIGLIIIIIITGIYWGNYHLVVTTYEVKSDKISKELNEYTIVQISDLHNEKFGKNQKRLLNKIKEIAPVLDSIMQQFKIRKEYFTIMLSHQPEQFLLLSNYPIDLVLSGHTHGGQFILPGVGGLVAPDQGFFPKYDFGMFEENETIMIVSRGLGNSIAPS